jgi:hypothetical protein
MDIYPQMAQMTLMDNDPQMMQMGANGYLSADYADGRR